MKCGVRFCGGCNPRYNRRAALEEIKARVTDVNFVNAVEGIPHDLLLVIGGCTNCCASYEQFDTKNGVLKMWDKTHIERIYDEIQKKI
ncbi:hypothetical protein LI177_09095 [bacterium 210820-DFI.6.37]|nr:hypothetical protein [bacterium 210820-DFI.6.37]